jgi:hypothetical protein
MAKDIARNDPCSCGSGKKYKNCCLNAPTISKQNLKKPVTVLLISLIAGGVSVAYIDWETGIAVGVATLTVIGIIASFVNPPPSSGSGSPGAINFGG